MLRQKTRINKTPILGINKKVDILQLNEQYVVDARNIDFNLDGITKRTGYLLLNTQNEMIIRLCEFYFYNEQFLLGFTPTRLTKYNMQTKVFEPIGTNTYSETDYIVYDMGFNALFFTNNQDRVKYYTPAMQDFEDVPGLDDCEPGGVNLTKAKCLCVFENFLILANTEEDEVYYPTRVRWSRYRDYTKWKNEIDTTGMAGYLDLDEETTSIIALVPLKDWLVVFKEDCAYAMKFVGTPYVFVVEKILTDIGLLSAFSYTVHQDIVFFVGNNNIYMFNGNSIIPIGDSVAEYFFKNLKLEYKDAIRMIVDEKKQRLYIFYPSVNVETKSCDRALVFNIETKGWTEYDVPSLLDIIPTTLYSSLTWQDILTPWDATTGTWEEQAEGLKKKIVFSNFDKKLFLLEGQTDTEEYNYEFYFTTKVFSFENLIQVKRLLELSFLGEDVENLKVVIFYGDDAFNLNNFQEFDISDNKILCDISAKFFQFKFVLKRYDLFFKLVSFYFRFLERGFR